MDKIAYTASESIKEYVPPTPMPIGLLIVPLF